MSSEVKEEFFGIHKKIFMYTVFISLNENIADVCTWNELLFIVLHSCGQFSTQLIFEYFEIGEYFYELCDMLVSYLECCFSASSLILVSVNRP